ncbi:PPE domain-containing protein [Actinoalloteichus sp. AHMU CJ021]|uniref:PPE domain-containing protein n=2 Tax=Actinoalloteichus TaxID=65496 RepID=UPI00268ACE77
MDERSGVYWNGISHERIVDWLREPATDSLVDSVDQWERGLGDRFQRVTDLIDQALHASGAVWDGQAADRMRAGVSPLAQFAVEAGETARSVGAGARQVADSFEHLRREMPPVPVRPDHDAWVNAPVAALVTGRVDQELAEQEERDAAERARDLMREYEGAVGEATHGLPVFTPVPTAGAGSGGIADRLVTTFGGTASAPLVGGPAPVPGTPPVPASENTGRAGTLPPQYQPGAAGGQPGVQPAPATPPAPAHPGGPGAGNPVPPPPPGGGAATGAPAPGTPGGPLPGSQGTGSAPATGGPAPGAGTGGPPAGAGPGTPGQPQPGAGRAPAPQPFVPPGAPAPPPPASAPPAPSPGAPAGGHAFGPGAGALPTAGPTSHEHPSRAGGVRRASAHPEDASGRERADYLEDTDDVWGDGDRVAPPVLGMSVDEEHR